ncbi:hypothetical protein DPEC_G00089790 [Dallia pectoralis]|uniref:Uncharacterized protein n=1 Tax=Dallia pectoralis TaxID=75939 RepID=A0ACC2H0U8_DALPE|nr:hypothetical protein DPEC_G00089790 [Dallia pectoralis]
MPSFSGCDIKHLKYTVTTTRYVKLTPAVNQSRKFIPLVLSKARAHNTLEGVEEMNLSPASDTHAAKSRRRPLVALDCWLLSVVGTGVRD